MEVLSSNDPTTYKIECPQLWSEDDIIQPIPNDLPADINSSLLAQKVDLDGVQSGLDKYNVAGPKEFDALFRNFDFYIGLKKFYSNRKSAQLVSNAWLKCYEIIHDFNLTANKRVYKVFYNAELPGAFISATNHYCKTNGVEFQWLASSYYPEQGHSALGDTYSMYENYRDQWIMDKKMNGDLTNPTILREIKKRVLRKFPRGVDSYFSDAGVDVGDRYSEQEELNSLLNFGQVVSGLMVLSPGGSFCTKQYTFFNPLNTSLIMLLSNLFREFYIVKPETSRPTNREIYLIGKGYIGLLSGVEERLLNIMATLNEIGVPDCANYSFYKSSSRVKPTLDRLVEVSRSIFIVGQRAKLEASLKIIASLNANVERISELVQPIHIAKMDRYITLKKIKRLDYRDRLNARYNVQRQTKNPDLEPLFDYSMANQENLGMLFRNIGENPTYLTFLNTFGKGFTDIKSAGDRNKIKNEILTGLKQKVSQGLSDKELYQYLNKQMVDKVYKIYGFPDNQSPERAKYRVKEIRDILALLPDLKTDLVLDFGGGEGTITAELAKELKLAPENIYAIDIKKPRSTELFQFILADPNNPRIPLENDKLDLVISLMVLHHLKDPRATVAEFHRILKPGGYLLIREHDRVKGSEQDVDINVNVLHGFFEGVWDDTSKLENPEHPEGFYAEYRSRGDWTNMIESAGFRHLVDSRQLEKLYLAGDIKRNYSAGAKIENPYYYYYAVYQKV